MEYLIIILVVLVVILTYGCYNLLRKNEKLETIISYQQVYMDNIDKSIRLSETKLKELDAKGAFKSDDEVGWFFKNLLYIQQILNEFKLLNYEELKEKERDTNDSPK